MLDPAGDGAPAELDPGLTGSSARPVIGIDNGFVAGYRVRFDEAGADGRVRTSALLRYAQDVAWRHSEDLGFDRAWYAQRGRWWVARAVDLTMLAPISMGQTLRVSTAVIGHRRIWARRLTDCRFADGRPAATVTTDWVILDDRGRLVRIPDDFGLSFSNPAGGKTRAGSLEPPAPTEVPRGRSSRRRSARTCGRANSPTSIAPAKATCRSMTSVTSGTLWPAGTRLPSRAPWPGRLPAGRSSRRPTVTASRSARTTRSPGPVAASRG